MAVASIFGVTGGAVCPSGGTHAVLPTISDDHAELPEVFTTKKSGVDIDLWADGTAARATRPESLSSMPGRQKPQPPPTGRRRPLRGSWAAFWGAPGRTGHKEEQLADSKRVSSGAYRIPVGAGPPLPSGGTAGNPGSWVAEGWERKLGAGGRQAAA